MYVNVIKFHAHSSRGRDRDYFFFENHIDKKLGQIKWVQSSEVTVVVSQYQKYHVRRRLLVVSFQDSQ